MSNVCGGHGHVCCHEEHTPEGSGIIVRDPVCGKKLDCESEGVRQLVWEDAVFYFCDTRCMTKFIENPKKYIENKGFTRFLRWIRGR